MWYIYHMRHTRAGQALSDRDRAFLANPDSNLYCGPVLRHPAELIQAANDRSVVTV